MPSRGERPGPVHPTPSVPSPEYPSWEPRGSTLVDGARQAGTDSRYAFPPAASFFPAPGFFEQGICSSE